ncbi:MAG TPA: sulfite exporter TauE/SafE family protein [Acidobacteriaceae bacterium]|nr:sulfite exporter TauE/SafE family protein [Acidobacteriaceae bacterium]
MLSSLSSHAAYLWLVVASLIAGVMNAMAGGGSFITFPAMLAVGVQPIQANATNTVALWPGQLASVWALRTDLRREMVAVVMTASVVGGVTGAVMLLHMRQRTFLHMVPWLLLAASLLFGISGRLARWLRERSAEPHAPRNPKMLPLFLGTLPVCFYIGYFGAGAGFVLMTVLALFGVEDMRELNSLKVLVACTSNLSAVFTFIVSGAIEWRYCLISMVFAGVGGWFGAQYARRMNPDVLRVVVVLTGCTVAAYFFWKLY